MAKPLQQSHRTCSRVDTAEPEGPGASYTCGYGDSGFTSCLLVKLSSASRGNHTFKAFRSKDHTYFTAHYGRRVSVISNLVTTCALLGSSG